MFRKFFIVVWMLVVVSTSSFALDLNIGKNKIALKGYDAVAYFNDGKAVKGVAKYQVQWMGVAWYFSKEIYRDVFAKSPDRYLPQYGGYCAFAMMQGQKVDINPKAFSVMDGKLYLYSNTAMSNVWEQNADMFIRQADEHWKKISQ